MNERERREAISHALNPSTRSRRGVCSHCGTSVRLRADGTAGAHDTIDPANIVRRACPGGGALASAPAPGRGGARPGAGRPKAPELSPVEVAVAVLKSQDGIEFLELRRRGAPLAVIAEWAYSVADRRRRAVRKELLYSETYASTAQQVLEACDLVAFPAELKQPDGAAVAAWKEANAEFVAALNLSRGTTPVWIVLLLCMAIGSRVAEEDRRHE